nr:cold shock domain-containing protein [Sneathiella chinensis]
MVEGDRGPQVAAIHEPEGGAAGDAGTLDETEVDGIVTRFVPEHRYGLVTPENGGADIFFHTNMLERSEVDMDNFGVDAKVKCVVRRGLKGPIADKLEVL